MAITDPLSPAPDLATGIPPPRKPRKKLRPQEIAKRAAAARVRKEHQAASTAVIVQAVELVSKSRSVPWQGLLAKGRGPDAVSSARIFAIGLCISANVPPFHIARAFNRQWASIYSAKRRCDQIRKKDRRFQREWRAAVKNLETLKKGQGKTPPSGNSRVQKS